MTFVELRVIMGRFLTLIRSVVFQHSIAHINVLFPFSQSCT